MAIFSKKYIFKPQQVIFRYPAKTQKDVYRQFGVLAEAAARVSAIETFVALMQREQIGSTHVADGLFVPHCRLKKLEDPYVFGILSKNSIIMESSQGEVSDLAVCVLYPFSFSESDISRAIRQFAQPFFQQENVESLRKSFSAESFFEALGRFFPHEESQNR